MEMENEVDDTKAAGHELESGSGGEESENAAHAEHGRDVSDSEASSCSSNCRANAAAGRSAWMHCRDQREKELIMHHRELRDLELEVDKKRKQIIQIGAGKLNITADKKTPSDDISCKDLIKELAKCLNITTSAALPPVNNTIVPDFDPSNQSQSIKIWIKKVNECVVLYGWDDRTTVHYAMQKLQGLAKAWYQSQETILFTWPEWQEKLINAFSTERNYGQTLQAMLRRRSKPNELIEVYYYEKLSLINQCGIEGKRAVDCLIHGISDKAVRSSAATLRCTQPDQLLPFLINSQDTMDRVKKSSAKDIKKVERNNTESNTDRARKSATRNIAVCYDCIERGLPDRIYTKPTLKYLSCINGKPVLGVYSVQKGPATQYKE